MAGHADLPAPVAAAASAASRKKLDGFPPRNAKTFILTLVGGKDTLCR